MTTGTYFELNTVCFLGSDPEVHTKGEGEQAVNWARLCTAMPKKHAGDYEKQKELPTVWLPITVFERSTLENIVPILRKGDKVVLKGTLEGKMYKGEKSYSIIVSDRHHTIQKITRDTVRPKLHNPAPPIEPEQQPSTNVELIDDSWSDSL